MDEFSHLSANRQQEDNALDRLLTTCDDASLPLTFDVVGHLFHDTCPGHHDGPYPLEWWDQDPGTSERDDPLFYAPSMLESIEAHSTDHEICTHTHSHALAEEMDEETIRHELETVQTVHEEWGLARPSSIVMPRHQQVDYDLLSAFDIRTIRRPIEDYGPPGDSPLSTYWWLLTRDHPECSIHTDSGITETTCTSHPSLASTLLPTGQRPVPAYFRWLPSRFREAIHRRYLLDALEMAADEGCHLHFWTHLYNIANDQQWRAVEPALQKLAALRDRGDVEIRRMCDLPAARP